ncbi:probable NADH dehydrogenase [ubiquinone] 1 alpha subcomplex subunit 5, partial [Phymastichus coffea]|uniref:probable NADH dehydrogenase [ubiquinone] 1 alpha subcomplex subunit 5 n=1 Tax=Phymastichus coffea TaxID=108790 RepID=UPI00273B9854
VKHTTTLTGLHIDKNPRRSLSILYGKLIRALQKLPTSYQYRQFTETLIKNRASIVTNMNSIEEIEEKINSGKIEDLCLQAEKELQLVRNILEWKCWESPINRVVVNQWSWPPHF